MKLSHRAAAILLLAALPAPAFAHPGHGGGLVAGLLHPVGGLDHLAAMLCVGLWAASAGGQRVWLWPLAFLGGMAAGLATVALRAPPELARLAEPGIVASLIVIGTLVALGRRRPAGLEAGVLLAAGLVHGLAHVEAAGGIAVSGTTPSFAAGVLLGTAALHGTALLAGRFAMGRGWAGMVRAGGAATAMLGIFALAGAQL